MTTATQLERLESLKIGVVSGFSTATVCIVFTIINSFLALQPNLVMTQEGSRAMLLSGAIAFISGFLFGVTYRYVVSAAPNPHLKSGAVLAFGLVRGLAQLDLGWRLQEDGWLLLLLTGESVAMFAIAALPLNLLIKEDPTATLSSDSAPLVRNAEAHQ